jgi:hypothetical protein
MELGDVADAIHGFFRSAGSEDHVAFRDLLLSWC